MIVMAAMPERRHGILKGSPQSHPLPAGLSRERRKQVVELLLLDLGIPSQDKETKASAVAHYSVSRPSWLVLPITILVMACLGMGGLLWTHPVGPWSGHDAPATYTWSGFHRVKFLKTNGFTYLQSYIIP